MKKRYKGIFIWLLSGIIISFSIVIIFKINMISNIRLVNGKVSYKSHFKITKATKREIIESNIIKEDITKVEVPVKVYYLGKEIINSSNMLEMNSRYYFEVDKLNWQELINKQIEVSNSLEFNEEVVIKNNREYKLRGKILIYNNKQYMSINDLEFILNAMSYWDSDNKNIYMYKIEDIDVSEEVVGGKVALVRLEDVAAGGALYEDTNILKMKILGRYLKNNNIKFNVAWIPRYIDVANGIDNDFTTNKNFKNCSFISLLDSWIYDGGVVGIHGYTHQVGTDVSIEGEELSLKHNNSEEATRQVIENAIYTARYLNIPIEFFESPHYKATLNQHKIIEQYFNVLYEPYSLYWNKNPLISFDKKALYVPAPLRTIKGVDTEKLIKRIRKNQNRRDIITSFFYHPSKEYDYITFSIEDNNNLQYELTNESPIKNIIKELKKTNHVTITVDRLY